MKLDFCGIFQYYILGISMTNYSYFCPTFLYVFLLYLKLQSYFYPTFLHMPARKPADNFTLVLS